MLRHPKLVSLLTALTLLATTASVRAGLDPKSDDTVKSVLSRQVGQTVELRLKNGEKIAGKVEMVGKDLVQLTQLTGAEFYEAVIVIDDVAAVVARAKAK
jgi:hypothetical protein